MSEEPLDALAGAVGEPVTVQLKSGSTVQGTLAGYDDHMNLVLEAGAEASAVGAVDNTTVIRGDNVVSIQR